MPIILKNVLDFSHRRSEFLRRPTTCSELASVKQVVGCGRVPHLLKVRGETQGALRRRCVKTLLN